MSAPVFVPPAANARPTPPPGRRGLWALPLLLSLLFVVGVVVWAYRNDREERAEQRRTTISDALSTEAQLRGRLELEAAHLRVLADQLQGQPRESASLAANAEVAAGFRRIWLSVTWLDGQNRILGHVPERLAPLLARGGAVDDPSGLSSHLVAAVRRPGGDAGAGAEPTEPNPYDVAGEKVVVRYAPGVLLKRGVPWWLSNKYQVQLVDGSDQVIASVDDTPLRVAAGERASYRVLVGGGMPGVYLELTQRTPLRAWWRSLPLGLLGGFLVLIFIATALLRRQVRQVSRAEAAWRTEAAWRGAMEDSLTVGLRARDLEGRMVYMNRAMADMVGYEPEALLGRLPPMPYWPADSLEASMMRHRRNLAGGAPREGYEAVWIHASGRRLDVMVFEAPLVDAGGRHIGWMGSILDITERKRLAERERRHTETMAHHARLTMLGEVASTLAHELNQPLTAISSYSAGVTNSLQRQPGADPAVLRALQKLGEQAAHAGRIVHRIREFLTRREPQLEACDLNEVAEGGVALLRRELERQRVRLLLELDPTLPAVVADSVLIEQVVINLVRNAGDALAAKAEAGAERRIALRSSCGADRRFVRIEVQDNGPGLAGRRIEALCTPFYSTKAEGMGMGLAICRSIVEAHQGALDAGEAPGGGAVFSFSLRAAAESVTAPAGAAWPAGFPVREPAGVEESAR